MNRLGLIRLGATISLGCAAAAGAHAATGKIRMPVPPSREHSRAEVTAPVAMPSARAFQAARRSAGFRLTRIRSGASGIRPHAAAVAADAPRPVLSLVGLASAPERTALVNGVPGRTSTMLMSPGDTAGGLRVLRVMADRVTLTGYDTTWTLRMQETQ